MSQFSASFLYEAIDKVSPVLKTIRENQKKVGMTVAKTQAQVNRSLEKANTSYKKHKKVVDDATKKVIENNKKVQASMKKMEGMKNFGASIMRNVGIPFMGATTAMILAGSKFESSLASLQAVTGVSDIQLKNMKESIMTTSSTFNIGASKIADGMKLIGSNQPELLKTPKMLLEVTKASLTMSKSSGMAFEETSESLTNVMNQYGLAGDQAMRVANLLATAEQKGAVGVKLISESMIMAGTTSQSAGVSLEQTIGMIEILGKQGIKGATAGTALKGAFIKMATGADKFNPKIVGIEKALSNLSKLDDKKLKTIFGLEQFVGAKILIEKRKEVLEMTKAISGGSSLISQYAINMKTFNETVEKLWNNITNSLIRAFDALKPLLVSTFKVFSWGFELIGNFIQNNKTLVKILFITTAGITALGTAIFALGAGALVFLKLKVAMVTLSPIITAMTTKYAMLSTAIGGIGKLGLVAGVALAGWSFGKLLYEIPIIKEFMNDLADDIYEMYNIGGSADETARGEQLDSELGRLQAKRAKALRTNKERGGAGKSTLDVKMNVESKSVDVSETSTKLSGDLQPAGKSKAGL